MLKKRLAISVAAAIAGAKNVVCLTGAGVSAESGIPVFRGEGGLWRNHDAMKLATMEAFRKDPALVWQFYQYRRNIVEKCAPNAGHVALAEMEQLLGRCGKKFTLVTQNIDRLHQAAGSRNVLELHGSLWLMKRVAESTFAEAEGHVWEDRSSPLTAELGKTSGAEASGSACAIPQSALPHHADGSLLRPAVVWFGESLDSQVLERTNDALADCDVLLVAGTSSVVYPAAGFSSLVHMHGGTVVEFNLEEGPKTRSSEVFVQGPTGSTMPEVVEELKKALKPKKEIL